MIYENKFYETLENIFVGARIEGKGGYVNLLKIKEKYYANILQLFKSEINNDEEITDEFREEFFNKLYNFFVKYFSESGSVYYVNTANWQNVYEKVYTNADDVVLFWKTHMLYYVKSDIMYNNVELKINDNGIDYYFYFDVTDLEHKKGNEKRELIFEYSGASEKKSLENDSKYLMHTMNTQYSVKGRKTKTEEIAKNSSLPEYIINRAISEFKKQSHVDYFINKNAYDFLKEQLDIFLHQILLEEENIFLQNRLKQLKKIKEYALKLISFISQFENELVKVWNKPKFVFDSDYVMSLKTLKRNINIDEYSNVIKFLKNELWKDSLFRADVSNIIKEIYKIPLQKIYVSEIDYNNENIKLSYVKGFTTAEKRSSYLSKNQDHEKYDSQVFDRGEVIDAYFATYDGNDIEIHIDYENLYLDTKFLAKQEKTRLLEVITDQVSLDDFINGYLIKSDNYQFLNSVNKFNGGVNLCYIDPPFNTEGSYAYLDKFRDSTWLTMINDRVEVLGRKYMSENSSFFLHLDHHGSHLGRILADNHFGELNREIVWNTSPSISGLKAAAPNFIRQHDTILYYKTPNSTFNKMYNNYTNMEVDGLGWLDIFEEEKGKPYIYKYLGNDFLEKEYIGEVPTMSIGDVWNDVYSMMYTQNMTRENWSLDNTQKPENLLRRIIQATTNQNDLVMDFYVGTGTTIAAAHKLNRKWVGVDAGDFIEDSTINRMKTIIMGDLRPKLSIDLNWEGGGVFKYYRLEQYEDTLNSSVYSGEQLTFADDNNPYSSYVFFSDNKLSDVLSINNKNKLALRFEGVYKNIDWPETISNLVGLPISRINAESFNLRDKENEINIKYNFEKMDEDEKLEFINLIRPLIWWGN